MARDYIKHHGGCTGCAQPPSVCLGCFYFKLGSGDAKSKLPNLNDCPSPIFGPDRRKTRRPNER